MNCFPQVSRKLLIEKKIRPLVLAIEKVPCERFAASMDSLVVIERFLCFEGLATGGMGAGEGLDLFEFHFSHKKLH